MEQQETHARTIPQVTAEQTALAAQAGDTNNPCMESPIVPEDSSAPEREVASGLTLEVRDAGQFDPKTYVAALPARPGVYRMLDLEGRIIYVGKAANLRSRVASYFRADVVQPKVVALVRQIAGIEVTVTDSETEALLLECNLIKKHRPHYNVLLKDDKTFPFIQISTQQRFPRLSFYRGSRRGPGRFFVTS